MKLWDKIKGITSSSDARHHSAEPLRSPPAPTLSTHPVSGILIRLEEINDEVLSAHLFGEGYGILR